MFGFLSNVCHKVDLLPFEKYDQGQAVIKNVNEMYKTINHLNCTVDDCEWKRYHSDIDAMNTTNRYMDCSVGHVNKGTASQTQIQAG